MCTCRNATRPPDSCGMQRTTPPIAATHLLHMRSSASLVLLCVPVGGMPEVASLVCTFLYINRSNADNIRRQVRHGWDELRLPDCTGYAPAATCERPSRSSKPSASCNNDNSGAQHFSLDVSVRSNNVLRPEGAVPRSNRFSNVLCSSGLRGLRKSYRSVCELLFTLACLPMALYAIQWLDPSAQRDVAGARRTVRSLRHGTRSSEAAWSHASHDCVA